MCALHRLYAGDACAGRELETFQASPHAQVVAKELLESTAVAAEIQFFAASTLCQAACRGDIACRASEVDWLFARACGCSHRPTARQLAAAAVALVGTDGIPVLAARAVDLLGSEFCWLIAVDVLLTLAPAPKAQEGVCARLCRWAGRGADDELLRCALTYPAGIDQTQVGDMVEDAVRNGKVFEVPDAHNLPPAFRARLAAAARVAVDRGHLDAAASVLQDLPDLGAELLEPAERLLSAPGVATRLAAVEVWSSLLGQLSREEREQAFGRFAAPFFAAAAWTDDGEVGPLRDALWGLVCQWQLATPLRLTLLDQALSELHQSLQGTGNWQRAEAALWLLSKYAENGRGNVAHTVEKCLLVLSHVAAASGLAPLVISACAVVQAAPCVAALPILLDRRLVDAQVRGADTRLAVAGAVHACCAVGKNALWAEGVAQSLVEELQARAIAGEEGLVAAAAEILSEKDVRPLAERWAQLCAHATPDLIQPRARALFATVVNPGVCLSLWHSYMRMLPHLPVDAQGEFVVRAAAFVSSEPKLLRLVIEAWVVVWSIAEVDESMISALRPLVTGSARTSADAALAVEALIHCFECSAETWAPQVVDAALGVVEATVAPAGSRWPLTCSLAGSYASVLAQSAALAGARQPAPPALPLVGALASWTLDGVDSELGCALVGCLRSQEAAVRVILAKSDDRRLARRIAEALGL